MRERGGGRFERVSDCRASSPTCLGVVEVQPTEQIVTVGILHRHVVLHRDALARGGAVRHGLAGPQTISAHQQVNLGGVGAAGGCLTGQSTGKYTAVRKQVNQCLSTHSHTHLFCVLGEVHGLLTGRVPAAHHRHDAVLEERAGTCAKAVEVRAHLAAMLGGVPGGCVTGARPGFTPPSQVQWRILGSTNQASNALAIPHRRKWRRPRCPWTRTSAPMGGRASSLSPQ